jgi:murein DD-endopeptidase MepM/ murein hydrolase activator NlpD
MGRLFPARQIYFRSRGEVKFVTLTPRLQKAFVALFVVLFGWSVFASAQVLLRDEIIAAKDQRIAALQTAIDQKDGEMQAIETDVVKRALALEERQQYLQTLIEMDPTGTIRPRDNTLPPEVATTSEQDPDHDPALNKSSGASGGVMQDLIAANRESAGGEAFRSALTQRLTRVESAEDGLAETLTDFAEAKLVEVDDLLAPFKLKAADLARTSTVEQNFSGQGGPFIPLTADTGAPAAVPFAGLHEAWMQMLRVYSGLLSLPLDTPLDDFYISSRFGKRTDPITHQAGWHPGIDLAGWPGTKIHTPNAGTVTKAGANGSYGKMVEIDHGNGFVTRYGHLRKIFVTVGQQLTSGTIIGEMGCTGRCTDTHLHYEVIFNGKLRNPQPFMEAPDDVQQKQRQTAADAG